LEATGKEISEKRNQGTEDHTSHHFKKTQKIEKTTGTLRTCIKRGFIDKDQERWHKRERHSGNAGKVSGRRAI